MNSNDLLQWYLSNRNMGSLVPDTGRAVGFPINTAVQSGGTAMVPYSGNPVANPSTALTRSYPQWWEGQWSEVPKELPAPSALSKRVLSLIGSRPLGTLAAGADAALGPIGTVIAAGDGRADNSASDMEALTDAYRQARMANANRQVANRFGAMAPPSAYPTPAQGPAIPGGVVAGSPLPDIPTPNQQVANRFPQMDPAVLAKGDMQHMTPNQMVAQNFPPTVAQGGGGVPMPQPRPTQAMLAAQAPGVNPNGSIAGAQGPTSVNGAPLTPMSFFQRNAAMMRDPVTGGFIDPASAAKASAGSGWDHYVKTGTGILPRTINLLSAFNSRS